MTQTRDAVTRLDNRSSPESDVPKYAAVLGWSLFFIVPALYLAAMGEALGGGTSDDSTSLFVITAVLAVVSLGSAVIGVTRGRGRTRNACVVLLALQAYPLITRLAGGGW
ncbi:hypothetical protein ASG12_07515 [Williamsia sp. Leaf354]|uniref:hypothetical protein n=1 Tax=Williamsia sp. Leaf354 TaxID=1736349 RepID=UPI0006F9EA87|nr:hypothetical protein [Williamsia sp. Leaf354]KQS00703.1 hypothetical protein ASG12_07515 [Williamsia sp. Leaf354]